jgi:hypothetical protein
MKKEQKKEYDHQFYLANKERILAKAKERLLNESPEEHQIRLAKRRVYVKIWKANNKEHVNTVRNTWVIANPNRQKNTRLKYEYGITLDQYSEMSDAQNKCCLICNKQRKLAVDHDHITGKVRGLLCRQCNSRLGWFENQKNQILKYLM